MPVHKKMVSVATWEIQYATHSSNLHFFIYVVDAVPGMCYMILKERCLGCTMYVIMGYTPFLDFVGHKSSIHP